MSPQAKKASDVVSHPVRLRVLQAIAGRQLTTAQLREALPDVAQATLYRHVAAMVDGGFLDVVGERRTRGAVERTYALGQRMARVEEDEVAEMSHDQLQAAFLAFVSELTRTFEAAADTGAEGRRYLGFGGAVIYVDESDLEQIQEKFNQAVLPYLQETKGKQRVSLSTIILPSA